MSQLNIFGEEISECCTNPITGFTRDGFCSHHPLDKGLHLVCIQASNEFLQFSKSVGNDLTTPIEDFDFPGLKAGDKWCVCAYRWLEAYENNCAPKVYILSTNHKVLEIIPLDILKKFSVDLG